MSRNGDTRADGIPGLVSVMVPAYNAARTVLDTLESVAEQTYRPIQLVIIDDGSSDGSGEIIRGWIGSQQQASLCIEFRSQPNMGLLRCRQLGVELARGSYLQFLDADDLLHREKFARCVKALSSGEWDLVVARTERFADGTDMAARIAARPGVRPWTAEELRRTTITSGLWYSAGPLFTRRIVAAVGEFRPDVHPVAEELEFHGRVKLTTRRVCHLGEVLSFYRVGNEDAITGSLRRVYEGRIQGAAAARSLLETHGITSTREWISLLRMCLQTFYQTVNCCGQDRMLQDRAWDQWRSTATSWDSPTGFCARTAPRWLVEKVCRTCYAARSAQRHAAGGLNS